MRMFDETIAETGTRDGRRLSDCQAPVPRVLCGHPASRVRRELLRATKGSPRPHEPKRKSLHQNSGRFTVSPDRNTNAIELT